MPSWISIQSPFITTFPTKAALLEGIRARLNSETHEIDPSDLDWRRQIRKFARSRLQVARRYPLAYMLFAFVGSLDPVAGKTPDRFEEVLVNAGFTEATAVDARTTLGHYLRSAYLKEAQSLVDPTTFRPMTYADRTRSLEFGLDLILGALEALRAKSQEGKPEPVLAR